MCVYVCVCVCARVCVCMFGPFKAVLDMHVFSMIFFFYVYKICYSFINKK